MRYRTKILQFRTDLFEQIDFRAKKYCVTREQITPLGAKQIAGTTKDFKMDIINRKISCYQKR